jgi:hypothetical protein
MTIARDDDGNEIAKRTRTPGAQLRLLIADPSSPPFDRSQCPTERPCPRFGCWHHNWRVDERAGKPANGKPAPPKLLPVHARENIQSCSLDVADSQEERDEDGVLSTNALAEQLNETPRRTLQVEARALAKLRIVKMLEDLLDEHLRSKLPRGTLTTVYPENRTDSDHVYITLAFKVETPKVPKGQASSVTIRRRK